MDISSQYTVHLEPLEEGGYLVTVPALPGCITQGDSFEHALDMAREAIEGYLAILIEDGETIPAEPLRDAPIAVSIAVNLPQAS